MAAVSKKEALRSPGSVRGCRNNPYGTAKLRNEKSLLKKGGNWKTNSKGRSPRLSLYTNGKNAGKARWRMECTDGPEPRRVNYYLIQFFKMTIVQNVNSTAFPGLSTA